MQTKLFHLHIRKTAGTALLVGVLPFYKGRRICPYRSDFEFFNKVPEPKRAEELNGYELVSGHFYKSAQLIDDSYKKIVVLRDPLSRTVSAFNQIKNDGRDLLHKKLGDACFLAALNNTRLAPEFWNCQARALVAALGYDFDKLNDTEKIECAIETLQTFDLVGVYEQLDVLWARLLSELQLPTRQLPVANAAITEGGIGPTDVYDSLGIFAQRNRLDYVLYSAAVRMASSSPRSGKSELEWPI